MMGDVEQRGPALQKTILIVEDNELNLKLYRDLLQAEGYRVLHTKDGNEVLEIARRMKPDLILMDVQLPEVSGLDVTRWLKQDDDLKTIPVIVVTSLAMKGDEERIRESGCDAYIAIPISVTPFLATIEQVFASRHGVIGCPPRPRRARFHCTTAHPLLARKADV